LHRAIPDAFARRVVMGLGMGLTAVAIIYSPWGKRSGAHFNPAVTLTFLRLGKVRAADAFFYVAAQCAGGLAGVWLARALLGPRLAHPAVQYVATVPGSSVALAFVAEITMTFVVMSMVLAVSSHARLAPFTGLFAGALVATYIAFEAPISGMSLNPARSLASALPSGTWTAFWIYLTAPLLGMLAAAEVRPLVQGARPVPCAKLHHENAFRCIFCGKGASLYNSPRLP
jgi:aquaporin Z